MSYKIVTIYLICICVMIAQIPLATALDNTKELTVDTNAYELPQQGVIIPCELCVVLYPERYEKEPQTCPVCKGAKEHFQPAQMMTREMAQMRLHEIDLDIQNFLHDIVLGFGDKPVTKAQLKELRKLYKRKLIHLLVYDFIETESVKKKILQVDVIIEK